MRIHGFIMAHTHIPLIDYEGKVANTGGWTRTPIIQSPTKRGVFITRGEIKLVNLENA